MIEAQENISIPSDVSKKIVEFAMAVGCEWSSSVRDDILTSRIESPIEQLFFASWKFARLPWALLPQFKMGEFRVDFVVDTYHYLKKRKIDPYSFPGWIIELDGHQFHEKTKAQAAADKKRERELSRLGYRILRFSGSEVIRDPVKCVWEVFETVLESIEGING